MCLLIYATRYQLSYSVKSYDDVGKGSGLKYTRLKTLKFEISGIVDVQCSGLKRILCTI